MVEKNLHLVFIPDRWNAPVHLVGIPAPDSDT
jgi:hypothetical protein